ncbi:hypothetical protein CERSUDRAFT_100851 [Gelatoporia subvermispora B]|uniref:Uncharacterized protein n=1 Tax=Ceriporiopsis subvermispora (strain B) TaxID=914234 RepID=M2QG02_CERS8|nr:hypothetical protein CERSUDRAFT_100851 [Gelatoporia subvermispora B]
MPEVDFRTEAEYPFTSTNALADLDNAQAQKETEAVARLLRALFRVVCPFLTTLPSLPLFCAPSAMPNTRVLGGRTRVAMSARDYMYGALPRKVEIARKRSPPRSIGPRTSGAAVSTTANSGTSPLVNTLANRAPPPLFHLI